MDAVHITTTVQLGALVRDRRLRRGLTQERLALATGLSSHTVLDIETGKGNPRLDSLFRLINAVGLVLAAEDVPPESAAGDLLASVIARHTTPLGRPDA